MQKWNGSLLRKFDDAIDGNASVGTTIVVRNTVSNTLAVIYDIDDINSVQKNNPFVTDNFGRYSFFAPNGKYTIEFGDGSDSIEITLVDNSTLQELSGLTEPSELDKRFTTSFKNDIYGSAVSNMIAGKVNGAIKVIHSIGNIYSTGGMRWRCDSSNPVDIYDFWCLSNYGNVMDFGAKGDNSTDDLTSIQAAVDWCVKASDPLAFTVYTPAKGIAATLFFPQGKYRVSNEIVIRGSVRILGNGTGSYSATVIEQTLPDRNIFFINPDTDGHSSACVFESIQLGSTLVTAAIINGDKAQVTHSGNFGGLSSVYFKSVWFSAPQGWAINSPRCDDWRVENCTFDTGKRSLVKLGNTTLGTAVSNFSFVNNTVFAPLDDVIFIEGAVNVIVANNRVYGSTNLTAYQPRFLVDATQNLSTRQNIIISDNTCNWIDTILKTSKSGFSVTGNVCDNVKSNAIIFAGGVSISDGIISNNVFNMIVGSTSVFKSTPTPLNNVLITNNTVKASASGITMYDMVSTLTDVRLDNVVQSNMTFGVVASPFGSVKGLTQRAAPISVPIIAAHRSHTVTLSNIFGAKQGDIAVIGSYSGALSTLGVTVSTFVSANDTVVITWDNTRESASVAYTANIVVSLIKENRAV